MTGRSYTNSIYMNTLRLQYNKCMYVYMYATQNVFCQVWLICCNSVQCMRALFIRDANGRCFVNRRRSLVASSSFLGLALVLNGKQLFVKRRQKGNVLRPRPALEVFCQEWNLVDRSHLLGLRGFLRSALAQQLFAPLDQPPLFIRTCLSGMKTSQLLTKQTRITMPRHCDIGTDSMPYPVWCCRGWSRRDRPQTCSSGTAPVWFDQTRHFLNSKTNN